MRRAVSVLSIGALVAVLWSGIAPAAGSPALTVPQISLAHDVFDRCFSVDDAARDTESPLGLFAFRVVTVDTPSLPGITVDLGAVSLAQLAAMAEPAPPTPDVSHPRYAPGLIRPAVEATTLSEPQSQTPNVGYYRQADPMPTIAPSSYRFDLPSRSGSSSLSFSPVLNPTTGFTAASLGTDDSGSLPQLGGNVSMPVRLGHVHLQTHADAGRARSDALAYNDTAMGGGATFDARLGKWKKLGVDVSSHYEHLTVDQQLLSGASLDGTSNMEVGLDHLPVFVPAYADISKHTVSAGLAVPVSRRMTASVQVDAQHLIGGYGTPGLANLDANNMIYGARLTYQLKGSSAISLSAKQYRYQDNLIPQNAFTQMSANLNFTVKF